MPDQRQMLFEPADQVAAHDLRVIEIELDADIRLADLRDDVGGMFGAVEEIIRPVAVVDRLDQQRDVFRRGQICGPLEIVDEDALGRRALVQVDLAGEAMDRGAADRHDVVERAANSASNSRSRPGTAASPNRPRSPRSVLMPSIVSSCWSIAAHRRSRNVVGELHLDALEAAGRRGVDPFDQRTVGEQVTDIGGKTGHSSRSPCPRSPLVPAKAGTQERRIQHSRRWIPAYAGMSGGCLAVAA